MNISSSLIQNTNNANLVVGAGVTGLSCLRYFKNKGLVSKLYDDALNDDKLEKIHAISNEIAIFDQASDMDEVLKNVNTLLLSPGVSLKHPLLEKAQKKSLELIGDVELFARENTKPVIAVTGSNAKSTVVTLLSLMAKEDNKKVCLAGNIGYPLLDSLIENESELYVLELSSFQLDITESVNATVASILNVSPDHLDRYASFDEYAQSKQKIYKQAKHVVCNRDDLLSYPNDSSLEIISFGLDEPSGMNFGLRVSNNTSFLACGDEMILDTKQLAKNGKTDIQNALAAMAIARSANISYSAIQSVLKRFSGLAHRCELVSQFNNVTWINDSKGTNVGACKAAIESFSNKPIVLIAGGDSKGGDLSQLVSSITENVKTLILIGKDAPLFQKLFKNKLKCLECKDLEEAVYEANAAAQSGDVILLSPACSSLDMFKNYQERGERFKALVHNLSGGGV
jgi:UDP-N-acetylmuramoylalanine--D-glutamate ligase